MTTQIRSMTEAEQRVLLEWAAEEGWNPGLNDAACFWSLDPDGYLAAEVDGEMVGGGAVIRHNDSFGFMGLFIVHPDYRGRQLGAQLWTARRDQLLSRLGTDATIGLDGVDAMVGFYERGGFRTFTRHRRFELLPSSTHAVDATEVTGLEEADMEEVLRLDRDCFPGDRSRFMIEWIQQAGAVSMGYRDDQGLSGYGVMRPCLSGWKIGPLFAEHFEAADSLFRAMQARAGEESIYLDVPDNNADALRLCRQYGMNEVFGCTRMYLGPVPELMHRKIYGVTTLEVG